MVIVTAAFKSWLKASTNMRLSSDASVNRVIHEEITDFTSLIDFDKDTILHLPKVCKEPIAAIQADPANNIPATTAVPGANVSSITVQRLLVACRAAKYYDSIDRVMSTGSMHYTNILSNFKIEYEAYEALKKKDAPEVPKINDKDGDRKIIRWAPIFLDCMENHYGGKGPLRYVLRENSDVKTEQDDPLVSHVTANPAQNVQGVQGTYYGESGSLVGELIARLPHHGPIFKNDNATVFQKVEEAARGTSCESTIKAFSRKKDGRGAYLALISNHAGDAKYRAIAKKRQNLLQNIKWTGNSYPLESHISNHRQAFDDLRECALHITTNVPSDPQRVEYLIDSITSKDNTLQAAIGLIRANTNNMRNEFEIAAGSLIEVDPFRRPIRNPNRSADVSALAGRGSTGVDLRFHPKDKFLSLPQDQQQELREWLRTKDGQKSKKEFFMKSSDAKNEALKSDKGLKTVMSILSSEEKSNMAFVQALTSSASTSAETTKPSGENGSVSALNKSLPATSLKLQTILKRNANGNNQK